MKLQSKHPASIPSSPLSPAFISLPLSHTLLFSARMSHVNMMVSPFSTFTTTNGFECDEASLASANESSSSSSSVTRHPCPRRLRSLLSIHLASELGTECSGSDGDDDLHGSEEEAHPHDDQQASHPGQQDQAEHSCTTQPILIPLLSYFKCPKLLAGRANLQYQRQVYRQQLEAREAFLQTQAK